MNNNFKFNIPAQLVKGKDGYNIAGLASTQSEDKQGETIIQKGIDLSPVDSGKGFFNFEHSNKPEDLIGIIDGYNMGTEGLYVHGSLFKGHNRAEAIRTIMKSLKERNKGAIGFSVEGQILERDTDNPKVIKKCKIKNVALTMNPVNTNTYASLVKSMTGAAVEFDSTGENVEDRGEDPLPVEKSMFTAGQVLSIVEKALGVGEGYTKAPNELTDGDAMTTSDMKPKKRKKRESSDEEEDKTPEVEKCSLRKMKKSMYKSIMIGMLDKLQKLYPGSSRSELWDAIQDRLQTRFPEVYSANEE